MRNLLISSAFLTAALATQAGDAAAGGSPGSIGVGVEYTLLGAGGPSVNYDGGDWHAGGFFGYRDGDLDFLFDNDSQFQIGGRFYYHVHSTAMSDFSVGGGIGLIHTSHPEPVDDETDFTIDLGAQIRAFIVANVALSAGLGIGLFADDEDNDGFAITGQAVGGIFGEVGIHYYFF